MYGIKFEVKSYLGQILVSVESWNQYFSALWISPLAMLNRVAPREWHTRISQPAAWVNWGSICFQKKLLCETTLLIVISSCPSVSKYFHTDVTNSMATIGSSRSVIYRITFWISICTTSKMHGLFFYTYFLLQVSPEIKVPVIQIQEYFYSATH